MKSCKKCGSSIPNAVKIGEKFHNLQRRKFCFDCSPFGGRNTRSNLDYIPKKPTAKHCKCIGCGKNYVYQHSKGLSTKECGSCITRKHRHKTKIELKMKAGGCCQRCGYKACLDVLCFHHKDPSTKSFNLSYGYNMQRDKVLKEVEKCILICSNCHGELHAGLWKIEDL